MSKSPSPPPKKLCFVVGPIGPEDSDIRTHADWLLEEIIQPVMAEFETFVVRRADQDHRPGLIDAQMINDLLNAELVIADLSGHNPNAFYEIGIRHMIQKPIIHMQLEGEDVPFDVSLYRAIKFSRSRPRDLRAARERLKHQVVATLEDDYKVENPVTSARGRFELDLTATEPQKVILERLAAIERRIASTSNVVGSWSPADDDITVLTITTRAAEAAERVVKQITNWAELDDVLIENMPQPNMFRVIAPVRMARMISKRLRLSRDVTNLEGEIEGLRSLR